MKDLSAIPVEVSIHCILSSGSVLIDGALLNIEDSRMVYNHSETFSWGFLGSGPAQLALAVLLLYLPEQDALRYHQTFKELVIAVLPEETVYKPLLLRQAIARTVYLVDGTGQSELF